VIVADTHAWIWWAAETHKLSRPALSALSDADVIAIASHTLWEVAMLAEKKRLVIDRDILDWLEEAIAKTRVRILPLTAEIAARATSIQAFSDPADRLIAATSLVHGVALVTKDERIQRSGVVATIW
jgi:PIN domain nuclease of toxin-antitoxin system